MRTEEFNLIVRTELDLQDMYIYFGPLTNEEGSIFSIETGGLRPYESDDSIQLSIIYEMDLDLHRIDREIYNALDLIGDLGGLQQGIQLICYFFLTVFNFLSFENYLVSELFKKEPDKDQRSPVKKRKNRRNNS